MADTKFEIILRTEEGFAKHTPEDLEAWVEEMCFHINGTNNNPHQRQELQGWPRIKELYGPFFNGLTETGDVVLRYEDAESYNIFST